ncbi:MAG: hypothetical protein V1692_02175 [bacterium]
MSKINKGTLPQVAHILKEIVKHNLTTEQIEILNSGGYFSDLFKAAKQESLPLRSDFQKCLKLLPKLLLTESFDPKKFSGLGQGWSLDEDIDPRLKDISEIEVSKFKFETCLKDGETSIIGEEWLNRLKAKPEFIRFGADVFLALWKDYQVNQKNSILEKIYIFSNNQITRMYFMQPLRRPSGRRSVLYLYRDDDGGWHWHCRWLDDDWDASSLAAGCASSI